MIIQMMRRRRRIVMMMMMMRVGMGMMKTVMVVLIEEFLKRMCTNQ